MRSSRLFLATILAGAMALPLMAAAPAVLQPPITGSMYNGNNATAPKLEVATKASNQSSEQGTTAANTPDRKNGASSDAEVKNADNASNAAATGATAGSGANGSTSRAGGGN